MVNRQDCLLEIADEVAGSSIFEENKLLEGRGLGGLQAFLPVPNLRHPVTLSYWGSQSSRVASQALAAVIWGLRKSGLLLSKGNNYLGSRPLVFLSATQLSLWPDT